MRIGFDLDGVVCDFIEGLRLHLQTELDSTFSVEDTVSMLKWDVKKNSSKEVDRIISSLYSQDKQFWVSLEPCCSAEEQKIVCDQANEHNNITFVTARPLSVHCQTFEWLRTFGVKKPILISAVYSKAAICEGLKLAKYIDDRFFFAYDIAKNTTTSSYLLTTTYNEEHCTTKYGIKRVETVQEFFDDNPTD